MLYRYLRRTAVYLTPVNHPSQIGTVQHENDWRQYTVCTCISVVFIDCTPDSTNCAQARQGTQYSTATFRCQDHDAVTLQWRWAPAAHHAGCHRGIPAVLFRRGLRLQIWQGTLSPSRQHQLLVVWLFFFLCKVQWLSPARAKFYFCDHRTVCDYYGGTSLSRWNGWLHSPDAPLNPAYLQSSGWIENLKCMCTPHDWDRCTCTHIGSAYWLCRKGSKFVPQGNTALDLPLWYWYSRLYLVLHWSEGVGIDFQNSALQSLVGGVKLLLSKLGTDRQYGQVTRGYILKFPKNSWNHPLYYGQLQSVVERSDRY